MSELNPTRVETSPTAALTATGFDVSEMQRRADQLTAAMNIRDRFVLDNLKVGYDYGKIEGCGNTKVLLKSGAEKLCQLYGIYADMQLVTEREDFEAGLFAYVYRCTGRRIGTGDAIAVCEADASSHENKYRYVWAYENQLPAAIDKTQLRTKELPSGKLVYRVVVDNPADKRNTIRKMAQKRALVGMTVIATATSSLFATDIEPPDAEDESGDGEGRQSLSSNGGGDHSGKSGVANKDYGNQISEPQAKRLYAIRKSHNVDDGQFKAWLKAKYGLDDDRKMGYKIYDEICNACEAGNLELPQPAQQLAAATSHADDQKKVSAGELTNLNQVVKQLGKTLAEFLDWLYIAFPQYDGKQAEDILAADFLPIKSAFAKWAGGEQS